jgi:hypothetical protein
MRDLYGPFLLSCIHHQKLVTPFSWLLLVSLVSRWIAAPPLLVKMTACVPLLHCIQKLQISFRLCSSVEEEKGKVKRTSFVFINTKQLK